MNAREFFDAVVEMRSAGKAYYAYKTDPEKPDTIRHKKDLLDAAKAAEKIVDTEIARVLSILEKRNQPTLDLQ